MKTIRKSILTISILAFCICGGFLLYKLIFFNKVCATKLNPDMSSNLKSGLLIGFRWEADKFTTCYRTLWITPEDEKLKVNSELNFIVVPRKDEMFKLEPIRYNFQNTDDYIEYLFVHPLNSGFTLKTFEYENGTYKHKLNFVNENFAAVTSYSTEKSNNKLIINRNCSIVNLLDLNNYKNFPNKLRVYEFFGKESLDIINKCKKKNIKDNKYIIDATTGDSWSIGHKDGQWIPLIAKNIKSLKNDSNYILYNTDLQFSEEKISHNTLCTNFSDIKKLIPETNDAISSPNEDIIGIFKDNNLKLYSYSNNTIGKELLSIDLKPNETMVMEQWANKNQINKWSESLKSIQ